MDASTALWAGLVFILLFVSGIHALAPHLLSFETIRAPDKRACLGKDPTVAHRYGWVLKGDGKGELAPTWRFTARPAWVLYCAHQATHWGLIYSAQTSGLHYTSGLHWVNVAALASNALFVMAHLWQTHRSYDGLAQDVPEFSAQIAVLMLLCVILVIENPRRGLVWGWPFPVSDAVTELFKKHHAYFFSWSIVYTFWFHPCDTGLGLLSGFAYLLCILLQGSLFFTSAHLNPWWRFVSEAGLFLHASCVSLEQVRAGSAPKIFRMFFFGTLALVVLTYQHGLGLMTLVKMAVLGLYTLLVVVGFRDEPKMAASIFAIPVGVLGIYFAVAVAAGWVSLFAGAHAPAVLTVGLVGFSVVHGAIQDKQGQRKAEKAKAASKQK